MDDLFVDESDNPEYIGVKIGLLGLSGTTLIPIEAASVDEPAQRITVSDDKDRDKDGPSFDDDREITPEFESEVRNYYGVEPAQTTVEPGAYGDYYGDAVTTSGAAGPGMATGDTDSGEFREHDPAVEGSEEPGATSTMRTS